MLDPLYICYFIGATGMLFEDKQHMSFVERMRTEGYNILLLCPTYIPVAIIQYRFVREPYQIPYLSACNLLWNIALSYNLSDSSDCVSSSYKPVCEDTTGGATKSKD